MTVKILVLNKALSLLFLTLLLCNCSAQKINVNNLVNKYIEYNSSRNKMFNFKETYLLMGLFSENENPQNKILSISYNCFECHGNIPDKNSVFQYKGYKVVIFSDNNENKLFLLNHLKKITPIKEFSAIPFDKNMIYDPPVSLGVRFDRSDKVFFVCMGSKTKEIKKILGFAETIEDCEQ